MKADLAHLFAPAPLPPAERAPEDFALRHLRTG